MTWTRVELHLKQCCALYKIILVLRSDQTVIKWETWEELTEVRLKLLFAKINPPEIELIEPLPDFRRNHDRFAQLPLCQVSGGVAGDFGKC